MRFTLPFLTALLLAPLAALTAGQVRTGTWTETWPDKDGQLQTIEVTAELWTEAFQADLDAEGQLHIPAREKPYYLDGPIVLKSGQKLTADAKAEIRLKPGSNTCMVRNENIVGFADQPVPEDTQPDSDITIEGGIWTTLANGVKDNHGNQRGHSSKLKPVPGTHGVILLHNVRKVSVRNVTVRQSRPFAIHLGNIRDFTVDGLTLDRHGAYIAAKDGWLYFADVVPIASTVTRLINDGVPMTKIDKKAQTVTLKGAHGTVDKYFVQTALKH